jgi:hypothetical protein
MMPPAHSGRFYFLSKSVPPQVNGMFLAIIGLLVSDLIALFYRFNFT